MHIILRPAEFYRDMPAVKDQREALLFLCVCAFLYGLAATSFAHENHHAYFFLLAANRILTPVVTAAGLYLFLWAAGTPKPCFAKIFKIVAYANTVLLLAWIPGIEVFTEFFKYYLVGTGLVKCCKMTWTKALAAIFATLAALLLALALAGILIGTAST